MTPQLPSSNKHPALSESLPLFMSPPSEEPTDNPALSALQNFVHDGTPDGRALPRTAQAVLTRIHEEEVRAELQGARKQVF
jgi:hypothetical protein